MLGIGGAFFLQIPDDSKRRILHPGEVVGLEGNAFTAELEEEDLDIAEGRDVFVFYNSGRDFLQQAARILKVFGDEPKLTVEFETTGDPVSAESRQCFRVATVTVGLVAGLGKEDQCPLMDVSCTGFSVISGRSYAIGNIIQATLSHQGEEYIGEVSVQSIREVGEGRIRYGLHCAENKASAGNLSKGLQLMTSSLQSQQLRRLAGTT